MEYIGKIVTFHDLDIFGDKEWNNESIKVFTECIDKAEKIFNENINLLVNNKKIYIYYLFEEINILFYRARLLKSYPDLRNRYINLIKKYLPYVRFLTKDEYIYLIEKEFGLMNEIFKNIPSIKGDIQSMLIKFNLSM
jgi:hypothetical protein